MLGLNATTLASSAIVAVVNGIAMFLAVRYTARIVEKIESKGKNGNGKKD